VLIVVALVGARSSAMAINRLADQAFDARNPRTQGRALPAGRVTRTAMAAFTAVALAVFVSAAAALNTLCLALSPVALLFLVGYSWTKRFTALCHFILGITLGIAPLGAWAAVRGTYFDAAGAWVWTPWLIALGVAAWVAGFDVLYACPDAAVDRGEGLRSIPRVLGERGAFLLSHALHVATIALLAATLFVTPSLGVGWTVGVALGALVLLVEHLIVRPGRYARMATAFFRLNALFGALVLAGAVWDVFVD
jgi:4-hydroxybenzoate polyprenyltransferase